MTNPENQAPDPARAPDHLPPAPASSDVPPRPPEPVQPPPVPPESAAPSEARREPEIIPSAPPVLDEGTYERIREPRRESRLELDGAWHQISKRYVVVQYISIGIGLALLIVGLLVLTLVMHQVWAWIPGGVGLALGIWLLIILPRQARAYGYQLRHDDLVFRRGILWQRVVAVPYGRMQLVDITHGPLDRGFGIAQLKLVTAAASTGVVIPGLAQAAAEQLRDTLIDVAETRRTGL